MNLRSNKVGLVIKEGKAFLKEKGAEQYSLDAELFAMKAFDMTKIQLFTRDNDNVDSNELKAYAEMLELRGKGVPTQYILGSCEFMGLEFNVNPNVLIPRADTEILVETVLKYARLNNYKTFIDMCSGSGCIAISLAVHGGLEGYGADISDAAISVAESNSVKNGTDNNLRFIKSDIFEVLTGVIKADIIVSNPPYIETQVIDTLMTEVKDNEPVIALDGGCDGLDFYRKITAEAGSFINCGGGLFFEIGYNQAEAVKGIMKAYGFKDVEVIKDLAGLDRVVFGFKK